MTALRDTTRFYKALAHPARLRILAMLRGGGLCACQITAVLGLAPSTVSAHLAELRRAGLVTERKDGRWVHFALAEEGLGNVADVWRRIGDDPDVLRDAQVLGELRRVPVEELCRVDLQLERVAISRDG